MKEKKDRVRLFKKIIMWTGIILTGLCGIILLGGDKITSGSMLIVTSILMAIPIKNKILRWIRVGFIGVVFCLVVWNISTTDLPSDFPFIPSDSATPNEPQVTSSTGIRFIDQLIHIFNGFLKGRLFKSL